MQLEGRSGFFFAHDTPHSHLAIEISSSLIPVLMPLMARLRRLFDLDTEPTIVDAHLERGGLGALVTRRPGLRIPGSLDGFEVALRVLLSGSGPASDAPPESLSRVVAALGDPIETPIAGLTHLPPSAARIAEVGEEGLTALGVAKRRAHSLTAIARAILNGTLRLDSGTDVAVTQRALLEVGGIGASRATAILMRCLYWPDAFPTADQSLQRVAGTGSAARLIARAEQWRPWRAYAALHLRLDAAER